jgi:hypothetical protein
MIHIICQWLIVLMFVGGMFGSLHTRMFGAKAKEPDKDFTGVLVLAIMYAVFAYVYWQAGAFPALP